MLKKGCKIEFAKPLQKEDFPHHVLTRISRPLFSHCLLAQLRGEPNSIFGRAALRFARCAQVGGECRMTDTANVEAPVELESSSPSPDVAVLETASPAAAPDVAPADAAEDPETPDQAAHVERALPLRQAVLDALADADEPLTVSRIIAELPAGTTRNTAEQSIRRLFTAGLVERVSPGCYALAPAKPPAPPETVPSAEPPAEPEIDQAALALQRDRERKRLARRKDREEALAKQEEADRVLRDQLINAAGRNVQAGAAGLSDLSVPRCALQLGIPLATILSAVGAAHHPLICPKNERATSWRSPELLRRIARQHARWLEQRILAHLEAVRPRPLPPAVDASDDAPAVPRNQKTHQRIFPPQQSFSGTSSASLTRRTVRTRSL
jgi:hypothetical protein